MNLQRPLHFYEFQMRYLLKFDIFNQYLTTKQTIVPVESPVDSLDLESKWIALSSEFDLINNYEFRKKTLKSMIERTMLLPDDQASMDLTTRILLCTNVWEKFIENEKSERYWIHYRDQWVKKEKAIFQSWMNETRPDVEDQNQVRVCIEEFQINHRLKAALKNGTLGDAIETGLDAISAKAKASGKARANGH